MAALQQPYYTPEQYVEMEEKAEFKSEYVSGRISAMAGASPRHNTISANVLREVGNRLKGGPCQPFGSDQRVTIMQTGLKTYPDVLVVCGELHLHPLDRNSLINPVVVFEVLSDSTEGHDRGEKWAHYRRLDSLEEYVLVSQKEARVELYVRHADGSWKYTATEGLEASLFLPSLDCTLPLAEVYDRVVFEETPAAEALPDGAGVLQ